MAVGLYPQPAPATTNLPWWSYDIGIVHFIGMSTEHTYEVGTPQYLWLLNDLKSVDRTVTPWVVFGGHRAMYINSNYGGATTSDIVVMNLMISVLEPLLYKYQVNFAFYGHNHVYQRMSAVFNKTIIQKSTTIYQENGEPIALYENPQATVHAVIGTAGGTFTKNAMNPAPVWNEKYIYEYGYSRLVAHNATHMDIQWINNRNLSVMDHMILTQEYPLKAWPLMSSDPDDNQSASPASVDLTVGASVGIAFGSLSFVVIVAVVVYLWRKSKVAKDVPLSKSEEFQEESVTGKAVF